MPGLRRGYAGPTRCACSDHAFARTSKHGVTLVDVRDEDFLQSPQQMSNKGYAQSNEGKLHRLILRAASDEIVDHNNHDKLDNRRRNLRLCNTSESMRNRGKLRRTSSPQSRFKGVTANGTGWISRICSEGQRIYLGHFTSEEAAAAAYDVAARKYHGAFALLNGMEV